MILKNRSFLAGTIVAILGVFSCVFDDTDDASAWMSKSGIPSSTQIQTISIDGVKPDSVWIVRDTLVSLNEGTLTLGEGNGTRHELFLDLLSWGSDSSAMDWFLAGDSSWVSLFLAFDSAFYAKMPQGDSLPLSENVTARFSWKLYSAMDDDKTDSLVLSTEDMDSLALSLLAGTEDWDTASMSLPVPLQHRNTSLSITLPSAMQEAFRAASKGNFYLQAKVRFEQADRIYRLAGSDAKESRRPHLQFRRTIEDSTEMYEGLDDSTGYYARYFQIGYVNELSSSHVILHGGVPESLYVDFPEDMVFASLQAQLQDSLILRKDQKDSLLTDRFVLLASMDIQSETSDAPSELGYPLVVYSYSVVDTLDAAGVIGFTEEYNSNNSPMTMVDSANIANSGRSNTIFWDGRDTLQLQITKALRYWLQSHLYGARLRAKMSISSSPLLNPKSYSTADYLDADSNTVEVVSGYKAYSRWDLGTPESLSFRLRLWLTEKR